MNFRDILASTVHSDDSDRRRPTDDTAGHSKTDRPTVRDRLLSDCRPAEYVTDRLERSTEVVSDISTRVRQTASERAATAVDRAVEKALDEAIDRAGTDRAERTHPDSTEDDPLDRALENFLRRYGLEADRLDDHTLERIRDRLAAEADLDVDQFLERLATADTTASGSSSGSTTERSPDRAVAEISSRLRTELDIEADRSLQQAIDDVRQRDAVVVGHAIERVLTEDVPRLVAAAAEAEMDASGPQPTGVTEALSIDVSESGGTEVSGGKIGGAEIGGSEVSGSEARESGASIRSAAALAITAMTTLADADAGSIDRPLRVLSALLSTLADADTGDGPVSADRPLQELLTDRDQVVALLDSLQPLLLAAGEGGVDLASLRSRSTGAKALVALFVANLVAMTLGAWLSHRRAPPIPDEIRGPDGEPVVTDDQVRLGKKAFQANGLMNHGSILGNGSYFGADLTADALRLKAEFMREYYARERGAPSFEALDDADQAVVEERVERELDTDAPAGSVAHYSAAEADAHRRIRTEYVDRFYGGAPERGIPQGYVDSPEAAKRIADFACWTAWMAHTDRPGSDHSYTNDWPYDPASGNRPTGQVLVWSTISVVLLVAGGGAGVWAYHSLDFAEPTTAVVDVPSPDAVSITPAQYAAAWYVPVAGALFVAQAFAGALLAHYYVERTGFFGIGDALGIDIVSLLPFSVARTVHINLAVLWITTLWLAGGLFLPGLFSDRDPPWQAEGATALLGLLVLTTVGAFAGVWLGARGTFGSPDEGELWWWLGSEGLEYLEAGRFWKVLLLGGFVGWTGLVLRSIRRLDEPPTGLGHFMTYAGGSIALMFAASMLYTPDTNIAITEFWRWWVVHMWVEGVFEFFVTAVISVALVSMNLVDRADAEKAILFEVFAIMAAGIVGVSHHYWWVGLPDIWVPIGTTFSTLEFVPLVFVLYRSFGEYRSLSAQGETFPYRLALLFIAGSSVWNFVGGGVLGFFINLPVINYYEHGTYLTVAHAHTATFGAFGLLALGLGTYILRVVTPEAAWNPTWFRAAFWLTNAGLIIMTVASLLPIGFLQLQTAYQDGYAAARSLEFYEQDHVQTLLWARTLGDTPMILGALAFTAGAVRQLWAVRQRSIATG